MRLGDLSRALQRNHYGVSSRCPSGSPLPNGGFSLRTTFTFTWLALGALVLPVVMAGTASSPELTDASGDAPAPIDVTAAWFHQTFNPLHRTGDPVLDCAPVIGTICRENAFRLAIKVGDLTAAAPLVDEDPLGTRYIYDLRFTPDVWGKEILVRCSINYVDLVVVRAVYVISGNEAIGLVGRDCWVVENDGVPGEPLDVISVGLSKTDSILTVTFAPDQAAIGPGTVFKGLKVSTSAGGFAGTPPRVSTSLADTTGVGNDWVMQ